MSSRIGKSAREHANCTSRIHAAIRASTTASRIAGTLERFAWSGSRLGSQELGSSQLPVEVVRHQFLVGANGAHPSRVHD
jgi:hypothetical protein